MQRSSIIQEPPFGAQPSPRGAVPSRRPSTWALGQPRGGRAAAARAPITASEPARPLRPRPPGTNRLPRRGARPGPGTDSAPSAGATRAAHPPSGEPPASLGSRIPGAGGAPDAKLFRARSPRRGPRPGRSPPPLPAPDPSGAPGPRRPRPTCVAAAGRGLSSSSIGTSCAGLGGDLAMSLWTIGVKPGRAEPRGGAEAGRAEAGRRGAPQRPAMPGSGREGRGGRAAARPCLLPVGSARRGAGGRGTAGGGRGGRAGGGAWGWGKVTASISLPAATGRRARGSAALLASLPRGLPAGSRGGGRESWGGREAG